MIKEFISADSHVLEPPNLWTSRLPSKWKEVAPRLIPSVTGSDSVFIADGLSPHNVSGYGAAGIPRHRLSELDGRSFWELPKAGWDGNERILAQELDNVTHEILFPSLALNLFLLPTSSYKTACFVSYNEWIAEYVEGHSDRLSAVAILPEDDIQSSIQMASWAKKHGFVACAVSVSPSSDTLYSNPKFFPLWEIIQDLSLPICMHILTERPKKYSSAESRFVGISHSIQLTLTDLIFSETFLRYPNLRIVSAEHDIGWIPFYLDRISRAQDNFSSFSSFQLPCRAVELFHKNVFATFQDDSYGISQRDKIGLSSILWGSDYPHLDSTWPCSRKALSRQLLDVPEHEAYAITSGNAKNLFQLKTTIR